MTEAAPFRGSNDQIAQAMMQDRQPLREAEIDRRGQRATSYKAQAVAFALDDPPAAAPEPGIDPDDSHHARHAPWIRR